MEQWGVGSYGVLLWELPFKMTSMPPRPVPPLIPRAVPITIALLPKSIPIMDIL